MRRGYQQIRIDFFIFFHPFIEYFPFIDLLIFHVPITSGLLPPATGCTPVVHKCKTIKIFSVAQFCRSVQRRTDYKRLSTAFHHTHSIRGRIPRDNPPQVIRVNIIIYFPAQSMSFHNEFPVEVFRFFHHDHITGSQASQLLQQFTRFFIVIQHDCFTPLGQGLDHFHPRLVRLHLLRGNDYIVTKLLSIHIQ